MRRESRGNESAARCAALACAAVGEASGKASKGVAKYSAGNAGMQQQRERAAAATSEIGRAKLAAIERGEKLGQLSDVTERMRDEAEQYSAHANQIMQKYKNKKWYQF